MTTSSQKFAAFAFALFIFSPALTMLTPASQPVNNYDSEQERSARNASAFAQMLGEFRTSLADMLFVKTERYLDSGIGYEPHIDAREMERSGSIGEKALDSSLANAKMQEAAGLAQSGSDTHNDHSNHDHDHANDTVNTLIRDAHRDFRGFIGRLERKVKPWRDPNSPHQHTAGTELLPWYRLATLSDPKNVRNYMIGAWWLKGLQTEDKQKEAVKFLDEGIAHNPEAYELYLMKGYITRQLGDIPQAKDYFAKSAELALKERPPGGPDEAKTWDITDEEQMVAAMTMHTLLTRDLVTTAAAHQVLKEYRSKLPNEGALLRVESDLDH